MLSGNGRSFPVVDMTMTEFAFRKGALDFKKEIGVWRAGQPGNVTFAKGRSLRPFKVIGVYRVAVVVVSRATARWGLECIKLKLFFSFPTSNRRSL